MKHIYQHLQAIWHKSCSLSRVVSLLLCGTFMALIVTATVSCERRPELKLRKEIPTRFTLTIFGIDMQVFWDYGFIYNTSYDFGLTFHWDAFWYYGWDAEDDRIFGSKGYVLPDVFNLRRYYTGQTPYAPHTTVYANTVNGNEFAANYEVGFWDILVWNDIRTPDNVQSLNFDENSSLDSVFAYTNETQYPSRYQAPLHTHAFYQPEGLFSAYQRAIEITEALDSFEYDAERNLYFRRLNLELRPVTYIYLTQILLHHNNGKITAVDGSASLSGMARSANISTGQAGSDAVTVHYNVRLKNGCPVPVLNDNNDTVEVKTDIIGGRVMTFGIPALRPYQFKEPADTVELQRQLRDKPRNYIDVNMQFNNGTDTTFVFDVTDQVRRYFRGGVITMELDMDTIRVPSASRGSGFDASVEDYKEETHEFDM